MAALGRKMLERATSEAARWFDRLPPNCRLAINVSPQQITAGDFIAQFDAGVAASGFPSHQIELEVTERVHLDLIHGGQALATALAQRGVRISIDDFGTGYSSLSTLASLPVDTLKIDRLFVQAAITDHRAAEIVRAVVELSRALEISCVAEGIETLEQLNFVSGAGCRYGQGFLLAYPMRSRDLEDWLAGHGSRERPVVAPPAGT